MPRTVPCTRCANGNVVELEMKVASGRVLAMSSCTRCETRTWTADGEPVSRDEVLKITAGNPDFQVVPNAPKPRRTRAAR